MTKITEAEFARICAGIRADRESITKFNPIGSDDEVLLWMLMSSLVIYLNIPEMETPCFTGRPDAATYRNAVIFILKDRKADPFDPAPYLDELSEK